MRYTKRETLVRAVEDLKAEYEKAEQALKDMNDEEAAAKAVRDEQDALVAGRVLWRQLRERWQADSSLELADKERFAKILVNKDERQAFGLPPLPRAQRKSGPMPAVEAEAA